MSQTSKIAPTLAAQRKAEAAKSTHPKIKHARAILADRSRWSLKELFGIPEPYADPDEALDLLAEANRCTHFYAAHLVCEKANALSKSAVASIAAPATRAVNHPAGAPSSPAKAKRGRKPSQKSETSRTITPRDSDIARPVKRAPRPACYDDLIMGDGEIPRPRDLMANASMILRTEKVFQGRLRYDEFRCAVVCKDMPWNSGGDWREWKDTDDIRFAEWCQYREIPLRPGTCAQAVSAVADDNKFHPIRDYLAGLAWDGVSRLDTWLIDYLGVEDTPYARAVGRCWIVSGVARIWSPGCKVDHALILEGEQRQRKSTALKSIMPDEDWFTDELAAVGTKDAAQGLLGKWLIEIAELSAMRRSEVETVKAFFSRAVDYYRPSYGRRAQSFPRQSIFAGTTNAETYLIDETGNRRFWPVRCGVIDLQAIRRDRDQLWAEANHAYRSGERWWLDDDLEAHASEQQQARRIPDAWEDRIINWADAQSGDITISRIFDECLEQPLDRRDQAGMNRIVRVLRAAGYERRQVRRNGKRIWAYSRASPLKSSES